MIKLFKYFTIILSFIGLTLSTAYADPKKVGFIYIGPPGDHGWTYMHDVGRKPMQSQLGDAVTTTYIENVPENADAVRAIRKFFSNFKGLIHVIKGSCKDQIMARRS